MKREHVGYCHICQKYGKLSFEHIPPKVALNNKKTAVYSTEEILESLSDSNRFPWDRDGIKYKLCQKGLGDYTLCERCNNLTGALYGEEYAKWFYGILEFIKNNYDSYMAGTSVTISIGKTYPGRFIRQVLSFVTSNYPAFTQKYPYIKDLILDKNYIYKGKSDFKIYMYLLKNPNYFLSGPMGIMYTDRFKIIDELTIYPFGFIISFSNEDEEEMNITNFMNVGYNDQADVELNMKIHEKNTLYPLDYRTKDEIKKSTN